MNLQLHRRTLSVAGGFFLAVILLLAAVLWWHHPSRHAGRIDVSPFENDMMESLVRGILHEPAIRDTPVCFLSFGEGGTPPSSGFIARFADCHHPAVRSVGSSVAPPIHRFFEKDNGRPGLIVKIVKFNEYIPTVFDITVSFSNLPAGHDQIVYRISNAGGDWSIKKRTPA